jgi:hypothetical protein
MALSIGSRGAALAALTIVAITLGALDVNAQDAATQQAKQYFDDGQNLYLQGKFVEAAAKFTQAYEAKPFSAFLFNVAVCYEKNKDYQRALDFYQRFVEAQPRGADSKLVDKRIAAIQRYLNPPIPATSQPTSRPAEKPQLPTLPPVKPKGLVVVESNPEGAAIYLGDKASGIFTRTPYTGSLPPGQQTLILELKEYKPVRKTVFVRSDRLTYLYFALTPQKNLGWIEVKGNIPGANIYLDKRAFGAVGRTPYSGHLRPGKRKLIIERPGYDPYESDVTIVAGKTHVVNFKLEKVRHGWLKVTGKTTKDSQVYVDDAPFPCDGYPCRGKIAPGSHRVRVSKDGFKDYETKVSVERTEEVQIAVRLNPKPSRIKAYVSFAMAAVLLGGGIAAGVISNQKKDSIEQDLEDNVLFDSGDSRFSQGKISAIIANSAFALSGVAGVLGVYYLLRKVGPDSYGETRSRKITVAPLIGPAVAGVGGQVRF